MFLMNTSRYRDLNTALREHFGCRVQKITLDAGLTCPNRDGTLAVVIAMSEVQARVYLRTTQLPNSWNEAKSGWLVATRQRSLSPTSSPSPILTDPQKISKPFTWKPWQ
jgi:hypothetical protein